MFILERLKTHLFIHALKHLVLVGLLVLFSSGDSFGQMSMAEEIVRKAWKKHTSGKSIERFEVSVEYVKPGKIPKDFKEPNLILMLIDSMMPTLPDSTRQQMAVQIKEGQESLYQSSLDFTTNRFEYHYLDLRLKKGAYKTFRPNILKGATDSSKVVFGTNSAGYFSMMFKLNPILLLQLMSSDSTELNYIGKDIIDNKDYQIVQFKLAGKWFEVYFDEKRHLVRGVKEQLVDSDPLIGNGPEHYKNLVTYKEYSKNGQFLLPALVEEMNSRSEFSTKKKLTWKGINMPVKDSVFLPWPSDEELIKFRTFDIGNGLFVLEKMNAKFANMRSLVRKDREDTLDIFTELSNNYEYNNLFKKAFEKEFPGSGMNQIFQIEPLSGIASLSCFFATNDKIVVPKGRGFIAEQQIRSMNSTEDSSWSAAEAKSLIESFEKDFKKGHVVALVLNPSTKFEHAQYFVTYYLPVEKVIYFNGNPYSTQKTSKNAVPREKLLYELIKERNLLVEKVVYSGSYLDNAPPFMSFEEFEKRVLSTDFSVFKKLE